MSTISTTTSSPTPPQDSPWWAGGRKRRNSESSLASLKEFVTGRRSSFSADGAAPNVLRKKHPESKTPESKKPEPKKHPGPAAPRGRTPEGKTTTHAGPRAAYTNDRNHEKSHSR